MKLQDLLQQAYVEGWRKSLEAYSVWKDGQQLTAMGRKEIAEAAGASKSSGQPLDRGRQGEWAREKFWCRHYPQLAAG